MAKQTAAEKAAADAAAQTTGTVTEGGEQAAAAPKAKKEKIFTTSLGLSEIRKKEQKLTQKYNRIGRSVKDLGLDENSVNQILEILKGAYEAEAKNIFAAPPAEEVNQQAAGSFV